MQKAMHMAHIFVSIVSANSSTATSYRIIENSTQGMTCFPVFAAKRSSQQIVECSCTLYSMRAKSTLVKSAT